MINEYELNYIINASAILNKYCSDSYYIGGFAENRICMFKTLNTSKWIVTTCDGNENFRIESYEDIEDAISDLVHRVSLTDTEEEVILEEIKLNIKSLRRIKNERN